MMKQLIGTKRAKLGFLTLGMLAGAVLLAGCGGQQKAGGAQEAQETSQAETAAMAAESTAVSDAQEKKLKLVASFYPMYDFARKIAGERADIQLLVPAGAEPHDWEPSAKDLAVLEQADALIYNGAGMEFWLDSVKGSLDNQNLKFIEASEGIKLRQLSDIHDAEDEHHEDGEAHEDGEHHEDGDTHEMGEHAEAADAHKDGEMTEAADAHKDGEMAEAADAHKDDEMAEAADAHKDDEKAEAADAHKDDEKGEHAEDAEVHEDGEHEEGHHHHHGPDAHVWLNPLFAKQELKNIADALSALDAAGKDEYQANYERYAKELDELDASYRTALGDAVNPYVLTAHEAFGYLCDAYGLTQLGIDDGMSEAEPDPAAMQELLSFAKEHKVGYVYYEQLDSDKTARTVAEELGAQVLPLSSVEGLTPEQEKAGADYFSLMKDNLEALSKGVH